MLPEQLKELVLSLARIKAETQTLEAKAARLGCPKLYDTLSSFSNQDDGGIIVFGVDEAQDFTPVGVYDAQDLQKKIMEQGEEMRPVVRPVFTTVEMDGKFFLSAEIPSLDVSERPSFHAAKGRIKGSCIRVGDADKPMTEYEIYSYEAYRKQLQDDIRPVPQASRQTFDREKIYAYILHCRKSKPNLAVLDDDLVRELMSVTKDGVPTLAAVLLFNLYPQAYFPQLAITATVSAGLTIADNDPDQPRFLDNKRIEGTIPQMLEQALDFALKNMKSRTVIDPKDGRRKDRTEYPLPAVREAILNALIHRDYSHYTESSPITMNFFRDRLEISNPGGLYGRMRIDQLGHGRADTRNPVLATALETLGITENRYSGIPTIRNSLEKEGLPEPEFSAGNTFRVIFRNAAASPPAVSQGSSLLDFCKTPRSRQEIADFLRIKSISYAVKVYVSPLVEQGLLDLKFPLTPRSPKQRYVTSETGKQHICKGR